MSSPLTLGLGVSLLAHRSFRNWSSSVVVRMLSKLLIVGRDVWRGMWQPLYPLTPSKRWWHYIEYWSFRMRDCIAALLIFLFPAGIGFLGYERYSANPKGTVAVVGLLGAIWICSVLLAYYRGRSLSGGRRE